MHSLTWEEAQLLGGADPDVHRRDLADAIESGAHPEWELGIQVFPDTPEETFEGIDLLDPTKIVPEELASVQPIGKLTLNRNPRNYFAETEQVAFNPGHLVPGIDVTDDPLLQVRLFSYIDTQLIRLGGPNFNQLPINRPHAPVNDMFRGGHGQQADHVGVAPYQPNSLDGGCPFMAGEMDGAFTDLPVTVSESIKERELSVTFEDHYSQASLFWRSMTTVEQDHIINAYSFELGKCYEQAIKERQLQCLANIDTELCEKVATALGLPAPSPSDPLARSEEHVQIESSPALSQLGSEWPTDGRMIGIVVDPEADNSGLAALHEAIMGASMVPLVIAPTGGEVAGVPISRTFGTGRSVEFDALLLAGNRGAGPDSQTTVDAKAGAPALGGVEPRLGLLIDECWRHSKAIGAWAEGRAALESRTATGAPGLVTGADGLEVFGEIHRLLAFHRVWERFPAGV